MRVMREFATTRAVNTKIYVLRGCRVDNWVQKVNYAKVFDPEIVYGRRRICCTQAPLSKKICMCWRTGDEWCTPTKNGGGLREVLKRSDMGWRRAAIVGGILYARLLEKD
ncbi:hypothetical protein V2J09_000771 [Rumex salicifolius]